MLYQLPPAGNAIVVSGCGTAVPQIEHGWSPFSVRWYGSGTSALAAAVSAAVARKRVRSPEVIVPAYACPDVVSAVLFAGATPVLVDLAPHRPWLDIEACRRRVNHNTVALVAINFLGIPERVQLLRAVTAACDAVLIEDCAQAFPIGAEAVAGLGGDMVVLSFGRGKPVSLLGGGAVLSRPELSHLLPPAGPSAAGLRARARFRLRAMIYNVLRQPRLYWLLNALPFSGLGRTVFKPLPGLLPAQPSIDCLGANIDRYRAMTNRGCELRAELAEVLSGCALDLAAACAAPENARLLRLPLLIEPGACARVDDALRRAGLGSSRLYRVPLPMVAGIPEAVRRQGDFPNARGFAASLLTLPTHAQVGRRDIKRMAAILRRELRVDRATDAKR
mgnify:CR=1 FL=1